MDVGRHPWVGGILHRATPSRHRPSEDVTAANDVLGGPVEPQRH
jgi:hypothetical protein